MGVSALDILQPQIIANAYSTVSPPAIAVQKLFGWETYSLAAQSEEIFKAAITNTPEANMMTGNYEDFPTRSGSYDIVDFSRDIAGEAVPGSPSKTIKPKSVGNVNFTLPRSAETVPLLLEQIYQNHRPIGGPTASLDTRGERYIRKEIVHLYERMANKVEFQTCAMLRGKSYLHKDGDSTYQSFTASGAIATVDYQHEAAGGDLEDTGGAGSGTIDAGDWDNVGTDIPKQIKQMSKYLEQAVGQPLGFIVCNSAVWNDVLNNTAVRNQAGSANTPFTEYNLVDRNGIRSFMGRLRGIPWVQFLIVDYGLNIYNGTSEAYTQLLPDDYAAFMPNPSDEWATYYRGCEPVVLRPYEGPATTVQPCGFFTWSYVKDDPASYELKAVHNGMPILPRPKAIQYKKVSNQNA